jgi:hydroxypyruvate reductase
MPPSPASVPSVPEAVHAKLRDLYRAAVLGADPAAATEEAVAALPLDGAKRLQLIAIGKAAHAMAAAAVKALAARGMAPSGGVVVGAHGEASPHVELSTVTGEHPVPGPNSFRAADRIAELIASLRPDDEVLVLLSGGGTALVGAPVSGCEGGDLIALNELLLGAGADITVMNAVRKRFSRWAGGRLAQALAPRRTHVLIVSDVPNDDPTFVASGPCAPDPLIARDVRQLLEEHDLMRRLPARCAAWLARAETGDEPETPKPGDACFARVTSRVILGNPHALRAAAARATTLGVMPVAIAREPLVGEARAVAPYLVQELLRFREDGLQGVRDPGKWAAIVWGGETTVTLPEGEAVGAGGRCQELALAVARELRDAGGAATGVAVLAAGTDGRDGPTDAAGAIVDCRTWDRIAATGRDPAADLARHDAFHALDAVDALVRTGLSGTNVRDVVIGLVTIR